VGQRLGEVVVVDTNLDDELTLEQVLDLVVTIAKIQGEPSYLEPILPSALDGPRPQRMTVRRRLERLRPLAADSSQQ
jgi:hypothetical protein